MQQLSGRRSPDPRQPRALFLSDAIRTQATACQPWDADAGCNELVAALCLAALSSTAVAQTNEEIWDHFARWVRNSPPTQVREKPVMDLYTERLAAEGIAPAEAQRRIKMISGELRLKSRENSILYWDAMFRFGGGPDRPLRLLDEVARNLQPGRAVDVAMGNGRNSLYLASLGWNVTGYDISPEGIALARKRRAMRGVKFEIITRRNCFHTRSALPVAGSPRAAGRTPFPDRRHRQRCKRGRSGPSAQRRTRTHVLPLKLKGFRLERGSAPNSSDSLRGTR